MDIKYEGLEKDLNSSDLKPLYLLYGEETYLIDLTLKKIKKKFGKLLQGINFVMIEENNCNELVSNMEVPAFGYEKKLIVVKNSGLLKKDGRKKEPTQLQKIVSEYMIENLLSIQETLVVVFVENTVDKNVVYDVIYKEGIVCEIAELKVPQLVAKLKQVCDLYQVKVENHVLQYLVEICGTNLQILMNEIRKLIEYAGEGGKITQDSVDCLAIKQMESVIFELTDNLGNKKIDKAMEVLENLIYQKEPLQKILITLYNHFKKLFLCSIALSLNKDITKVLNLKPNQTFLVSKYKKQVSYFKQENLRRILKEFVEIDDKSKNGLVNLDVALKSVLCTYCS